MPHILNIAHRGASGTRPENTLISFRRAMEIGADVIELDTRATADGIAVIMHDATVDRTTNASGRAADLTLEQIKELDAGSWFAPEFAGERVPTLAEAVALTGDRVALSLELKETGVEEQAVAAIRSTANPRSFISSFHEECLRRVRQLDPEMTLEFIIGIDPLSEDEIARLTERTRQLDARILAPSHRGITPALVSAARMAGLTLIGWTVDQPEQMQRLIDLGVDGITTNRPEVLKDLLQTKGGCT
jgi:glycerophosphoryl diester phosphodiesterase